MMRSSAVLGLALGQQTSYAVAIKPSSATQQVLSFHTLTACHDDSLVESIKTLKATMLDPLPWYQRWMATVVIGVEDDTVISKTLTAADVDDPLEQETTVGQALSQALNMDISDLLFDFSKKDVGAQPGDAHYQVIACRQSALAPILAACRQAKLNVRVVDRQQHGLQALYKALVAYHQPSVWPLWLHLCAEALTVTGKRSDGEDYQQRLSLTSPRQTDAGDLSHQVLCQHIEHAYQAYLTQAGRHSEASVWLSGDWPESLRSPAQIACHLINPGAPFGCENLNAPACVALGLALRGAQ
ncbi:hypothetical protein [Salinivibrio kushneri]|uniref:Pilus assembly protein PilM n=1 Tax=Salinivibrio kushneri TaxID=1908198 RepID=A0AA47KL08_9GAMM|nr:hypothetical protein [Salinivibrio kushneri]WBA08846.1 hypothetical protein N8M53_01025 [Salinivibrio kushneri]